MPGGALRAACGVQRSRGPGGGPGVNKGIRSIVIVWGVYKCANFGATKHVYAWKFATALQYKAALNSKHPLVQPPRSSFLGPRTRARPHFIRHLNVKAQFRFLSPQTSRTCTQHLSFRVFSHCHWALGRAHCPLSGAPLRALAAARRAPLARLIMCAPSRGLRLGRPAQPHAV